MRAEEESFLYREYVHAPSHLFAPNTAYIVTARTYQKYLHFNTPEKRDYLLRSLFEEAQRWSWELQAWAVMANHYHFIAHAPENAETLKPMLTSLHSKTAIWVNRVDSMPGRKIWYQYRDTCLTYERSYLARLNYVHHNPVKHGLVDDAGDYAWCSMAWFMKNAEPSFREVVIRSKYDGVQIDDDF